MNKRRMMLRNVQMADFALQEAALFLDGQPKNKDALEYFEKHQKIALSARQDYEKEFGPLTFKHSDNSSYWEWVQGPWPWEGEV